MSTDTTCVGEDDSVLDAAKQLKSLGVGTLPICGNDDRLKGMLTDRDVVVKVLAEGRDPATTKAGELGQGDAKVVTIAPTTRSRRRSRRCPATKVRRLPVTDGHDLVGMISQADIARDYDDDKVGDLVEAISA